MKKNRTLSRRLLAALLAALLLLGALPVFAEEAGEKEPFKGTVSFNINTRGLGLSTTTLYFLNLSLGIDTEKKVADLSAGLFGKSVDLLFAWDNGKPRFSVPTAGSEVYSFSPELIAEFIKTGAEASAAAKEQEALPADDRELGEKLTEGLTSIVSSAETTDAEGSYTYMLLNGGTQNGRVFTMKLNKEQWGAFWEKLFSIGSDAFSSIAGKAGVSVDQLDSSLGELATEITELTADWKLEVFYQDDVLRAVNLGGASMGFIYESAGEAKNGGRIDCVGIRDNDQILKLLESRFAKTANGFSGTVSIAGALDITYSYTKTAKGGFNFSVDFAVGEKGVTVTANYMPGEVNITMPGEANTEITDMDSFGEIVSGLVQNSLSTLTLF